MKGFGLFLVTFVCGVVGCVLAMSVAPLLGFREGGDGPGAVIYFLTGVLTAGFIIGSFLGFFVFRKSK